MGKLMNTQGKVLLQNLRIASSFIDRAQGLIGSKELDGQEGLWIHRCNSIHTCFMSFPIDCIFLDQDLRVKKVVKEVKPWRMVLPIFGAKSVIELKAGTAEMMGLGSGEKLHVST